jgi:DHA2 family multidrug resistance protein-like MFS transporter
LNALVISIAAVLGPTIASAILAVGSWPLLFWVNAPLGVPTVLIAMRALPHSPRSKRRLDWIAVGLNVLAFGLIFTGVDILTRERLPLVGGGVILTGILAAGLLVRRCIGQAQPLLPLDLMARPLFALTVLTSVASFAAQMLAFVALPFFFQGTLHRSQVATGVLVTPWPIAVGVAAPLAGRLADRFPAAILSFAGLGCLALGLGLIAVLTPGASAFDISWRMALCGLGFGFFQAPNNRTLIMAAPMERTGAAGGMLATARLTGQTVGATAAAALFSVSASGSRNALLLGAAFAAAAACVSISRVGGSRR